MAKVGLSQGVGADSSEKDNSLANSSVLTWGVKQSFFLALGVTLGLGSTGGFLPGLGRLDRLRQPRLHGACIKIVLVGGRGRGARGAHATRRGTKTLAYFFGPMA